MVDASHWRYAFCMSLYFAALVRLWEASHRQFSFALSCSSLNEGGMHPTGNLRLHLRMEVRAWKASQDYPMWLLHSHHKHVLYSMWNVRSQNSSWNQSLPCLALKLHFWLSFCYRSGCRSGRPRNRKSTYQRQRETLSCCVWLAPFYYRLARNDSHLRFCCERGHSTKGINQDHLRAEGFCYLSMARSTKKNIWVEVFRPSLHAQT